MDFIDENYRFNLNLSFCVLGSILSPQNFSTNNKSSPYTIQTTKTLQPLLYNIKILIHTIIKILFFHIFSKNITQ